MARDRYEVRWSNYHGAWCVYDGDDPDPVFTDGIAAVADKECERLNADDTLGWSPTPVYEPLRTHLRRAIPHPADL